MREQGNSRYSLVGGFPTVKAEELCALSTAELEALLQQEKAYNSTLPGGESLRLFFESLGEEELLLFVEALQERIVAETDLLDRFTRLGLDPFAPDLTQLSLPFPLEVVPQEAVAGAALRPVKAWYKEGTIYVLGEAPSLSERLSLLARRGIIGNDVFHEVFHGLQDGVELYHSLDELLETLGDGGDQAKVALAEAHAWLCCLPGFRHEVLIDVIGASYAIKRREHLRNAFELLYGLAVLGLNDEEVARLVGRARWCEEKGRYIELHDARQRLLARHGMDKDDLAEQVERQKLIDRIQAIRAVGIARELVQTFRYRDPVAIDAAAVPKPLA